MPRLLFEKKGNAIWISHLDLMRVFQRAFKRADLPLKHTNGFNPRPSVSIALPLSVGIESSCELLDFELDGCDISLEEIKRRLNESLIQGIRVIDVFLDGRKIRELALLKCKLVFKYDHVLRNDDICSIRDLFNIDHLFVPKKTKSGIQDQDIIPMIRKIDISAAGEQAVTIDLLAFCQNPTLNPMQIENAVSIYLPHLKPILCQCHRIEVYDAEESIFR